MGYVDQLLKRQDGLDPAAKMETFIVETASRRVMKELVGTFVKVQDTQSQKIKGIDRFATENKRRLESIETLMKRMQITLTESMAFEKRISLMEQ